MIKRFSMTEFALAEQNIFEDEEKTKGSWRAASSIDF